MDSATSVRQIQDLVRKYGGRRFEQLWSEGGRITGIRFALNDPEIGELPVSLPAKTEGVERILLESNYLVSRPDLEREARISRQAERIAWRHIKDLTEQLLVAVHLDLKTAVGAFLEGVETVDPITGETTTFGELFERRAEVTEAGGPVALTASRREPGEVRALPPAGGQE